MVSTIVRDTRLGLQMLFSSSKDKPSPNHVLAQSLAVTLPISAWQGRSFSITAAVGRRAPHCSAAATECKAQSTARSPGPSCKKSKAHSAC
jgi:hypothetical protein